MRVKMKYHVKKTYVTRNMIIYLSENKIGVVFGQV